MKVFRLRVFLITMLWAVPASAQIDPELLKKAESGNISAQFKLGNMYHTGESIPKDDIKAAQWFQKAADQGNELAQCSLGLMYSEGQGVPQDHFKAAEWFKKAADQKNDMGQFLLGASHLLGQGVIRDEQTGCDLIRTAAEQGHRQAIEVYNQYCVK